MSCVALPLAVLVVGTRIVTRSCGDFCFGGFGRDGEGSDDDAPSAVTPKEVGDAGASPRHVAAWEETGLFSDAPPIKRSTGDLASSAGGGEASTGAGSGDAVSSNDAEQEDGVRDRAHKSRTMSFDGWASGDRTWARQLGLACAQAGNGCVGACCSWSMA